MDRNTWKRTQRRVAHYFDGQCNTKASEGGVFHSGLVVKVKQRASHAAVTLWDQTKKLADKQGKLPVVVLAVNHRPGFWVLVHSDDLCAVAGAHKARENREWKTIPPACGQNATGRTETALNRKEGV